MKSPMQELLEEMEREGLIERTGELRANSKTDEPRPVFALVPALAAIYGEGGAGLVRYIRENYEFVPTTH